MDCFIKKIFVKKEDDRVHQQFVRFGKGDYKNKAVVNLWKTAKVKLYGGFEYANDFALLASEFKTNFSGIVISKENLGFPGKKKAGLFVSEISNLPAEKIKEIYDKCYYLLLDADGEISLKTKKKLPKPGKSAEAKVDDKFCQIETDLNLYSKIKSGFFWDIPECKKARASHEFIITDLIMPKDEKDFEQIRLKTKRKGTLIRKLEIDGNSEEKKIGFEA